MIQNGIGNIPQIGLGSIFEHVGVPKFARKHFLSKTILFQTNYSKPLRQPKVDLAYRVYLKPLNSILNFRKVRKKIGLDFWKNTIL